MEELFFFASGEDSDGWGVDVMEWIKEDLPHSEDLDLWISFDQFFEGLEADVVDDDHAGRLLVGLDELEESLDFCGRANLTGYNLHEEEGWIVSDGCFCRLSDLVEAFLHGAHDLIDLCLGEEPPFIKHGGDAVEHDIVLLFGEPTEVFDHL